MKNLLNHPAPRLADARVSQAPNSQTSIPFPLIISDDDLRQPHLLDILAALFWKGDDDDHYAVDFHLPALPSGAKHTWGYCGYKLIILLDLK